MLTDGYRGQGGSRAAAEDTLRVARPHLEVRLHYLKLPVFLMLTNTDPFAAWFKAIGDATPGGIRVGRSVLEAICSLPWGKEEAGRQQKTLICTGKFSLVVSLSRSWSCSR